MRNGQLDSKKQQCSWKCDKTHRTRLPTKQSSQRTVLTQWFGGKEVLKRTVKQHQRTNGNLSEKKKQRSLEYCLDSKNQQASLTVKETHRTRLPAKQSSKRTVGKRTKTLPAKYPAKKALKKWKKWQQTLRKSIAYLYGMQKHKKRPKRILVWKPTKFRRQNANRSDRSSPYTSLEGMTNCGKAGFIYTRIGSKVRVSD